MAAAEPPSSLPLTVLEGFKGFLLWVGGSLAGITAVLYACGYLVTRAHLSMLGLYGLVDFGNEHFLQEGAKFMLAASYHVVRTLLPLAVGIVIAALAWMTLRLAARGWRRRASMAPGAQHPGAGAPLLAAEGAPRRFAFLVLFVALVWHADRYVGAFEQPLAVANVLYAGAGPRTDSPAGQIEQWILSDRQEPLADAFHDLLYGALAAALLALLAWRTARPWQPRAWLVAPFVAALLLYLVMLPMSYGVLQRPVRYPLVALTPMPGADAPTERVFLLALAGGAFVLWDATARKVLWIPANAVVRAEVRAVEGLFAGQ